LRDIGAGVRVSETMVTDLRTLPSITRLDEAAESVLRSGQHEFLVVDTADQVLGVLTRRDVINALHQGKGEVLVTDLMHQTPPAVDPDSPLNDAFLRMRQ